MTGIQNPIFKLPLPSSGGVKATGVQAKPIQQAQANPFAQQSGVTGMFSTQNGPNYTGGASLPMFGGKSQAASRLDLTV